LLPSLSGMIFSRDIRDFWISETWSNCDETSNDPPKIHLFDSSLETIIVLALLWAMFLQQIFDQSTWKSKIFLGVWEIFFWAYEILGLGYGNFTCSFHGQLRWERFFKSQLLRLICNYFDLKIVLEILIIIFTSLNWL
jgi:hypothetical protein